MGIEPPQQSLRRNTERVSSVLGSHGTALCAGLVVLVLACSAYGAEPAVPAYENSSSTGKIQGGGIGAKTAAVKEIFGQEGLYSCVNGSSAMDPGRLAVVEAVDGKDTGGTKRGRQHESFHALLEEQTGRKFNKDPEIQSLLGLVGSSETDLSDRMTDVSLRRLPELRREMRRNLAEVLAWNRKELVGQERWSYDLATWFYTTQIDLMAVDWAPAWLPVGASTYAVDQLFSSPVAIPQFMESHHRIADANDAQRYVDRLGAIGIKLDQVHANFDHQARQGVIPPRVALEGAAAQIRELLTPSPEASFFVQVLRRKLEAAPEISTSHRDELLKGAARAVHKETNPAYRRLLSRIEEVLACDPPNHGVWALPDGAEFYDAALRWNTSSSMGADAVHSTGLAEVARIEKEMDALLRSQGLVKGSVGERMKALARDARFTYADTAVGRQELLSDVKRALERLSPHLGAYFERLPHQQLEVRPVPPHAEGTTAGAYYTPPAMDGSRPGIFSINLGDIASNNRWSIPTLAYHEGAPGHHFQISLSQALDDLPLLRRVLNPSAFTEGWALYAEQLVAEMGIYEDAPFANLGRLQAELFRSVRLVVDTGLHRRRWTMARASTYMQQKTGMNSRDVELEIHRYLVQPGQASSYKVGHLKMLELRQRAKARLGHEFDIRRFHNVVLSNGALPLAVLEQVIDEWIATQESEAAG